MDTRVALISIIVENNEVIDDINRFLHEAGKYIIGRMGIPYREKGINIISIAIDAPQDVISSLSGKIGRLRGVSAKTAYSNVITKAEDRKCYELRYTERAASENPPQFPMWQPPLRKKE